MTSVAKSVRTASAEAGTRPGWLDQSIYPFKSHFITLDRNRIHYIDEGVGPILLFVHGAVGWSFLYRDIIKDLRSDFRCIAVDWPGFGLSDAAPDFETTLPGNSRLLEAFITQLDLRDITIFGHDSGASMALGVVGRHPSWFRGMIIANAFGFPLQGEFPDITRFLGVVRTRFFRFMIVNVNFLTRYSIRGLRGGRLSPAEKNGYRGPTLDRSRRRHHHAILACILDAHDYLVDMEKRLLANNHLPLLLTFGNTDEAYKAGFMQRWQSMFPNHRTYIIDGGTHFPQEDDPQGIAAAVRLWWREVVEGQPR